MLIDSNEDNYSKKGHPPNKKIKQIRKEENKQKKKQIELANKKAPTKINQSKRRVRECH